MTGDETMDPRFDKLIALLYGELSEDEAVSVRKMIDEDASLRAEWDELVSARDALGAWQIEEKAPAFTVPFETGRGESRASRSLPMAARGFGASGERARRVGRAGRETPAWIRALTAPAWGLAAAAAVILLLAMNGFRVERLESGFAFRFGSAGGAGSTKTLAENTPSITAPVIPVSSSTPEITALRPGPDASLREPGPTPAGFGAAGRDSGATPASAGGAAASGPLSPYISRQEFQTYSEGLTRTLVALLNDYSKKQGNDITGAMTSMYQNLNTKQERGYEDLKGRIDAIGMGLLAEQSKTNIRIDDMLDKDKGEPLTRPRGARPDSTEEEHHDNDPR